MNVLVLGVGNILMGDEGIGTRAIDLLDKRYRFPENVELLDGGTSGIELLRYIEGRDHLILIDAVKGGQPPGTVVRVEGEDVPARFRTRISPHQLGISDLLATAQLTDSIPENMVLFGIEPKDVVMRLEMSPEVEAAMNRLAEVVVEELRRIGCAVEKLENERPDAHTHWKPVG